MFPLRDENPSHRFPFITVLLILANVAVFVYQLSLGEGGEAFVYQLGALPIEITTGHNLRFSQLVPPYLSLLTCMFLHGGFGHLIGNMWFLWIFGDNIEDFLGHTRFLLFYLLTGLSAGLVHVFLNPQSDIPTIGASGAISGILGAYMVLHPRIRIRTVVVLGFFWQVMRVPAYFFLGLWFVMQFLGGDAQVAYGAHIGGFVAGLALIFLFSRPSPVHHPVARYENRRLPRWH